MENKLNTAGNEANLESRVADMLREIGVPANILGYRYAKEAIIITVNDFTVIHAVSKTLYPAVAETFATKPSRVERAIRHAVEVAWNRGDLQTLHRLFGSTVCGIKGKPTNSQFIAIVAEHISMQTAL